MFFVGVAIFGVILSPVVSDLIVNLPDGSIEGHQMLSSENKSFYAFHGIPYASPPVGELRFQPPIPPQPWSGIRNASEEGASCFFLIDYFPDGRPIREDCLFINVYTPSWNISEQLPVMFWIHGGGFVTGSGSYKYYGPDYLLEENVIVVTFNYRLGPFGFLSTGDKAILGNVGLKDQLLALKWTKTNIALFGGDPEKITIFGESAGGMSIGLHLLSQKSSGLFRAAICHSGCSLSVTYQLEAKSFIYQLAQVLDNNISENNTTEHIRDFLLKQSAEDLNDASAYVDVHGFVPTLEIDDEEAFISDPNYELLVSGRFNQVPLILGTNSEESLSFLTSLENAKSAAQTFDEDSTELIPTTWNLLPDSNRTFVGELIRNAYVGNNGSFLVNLAKTLEYSTDNIFRRATIKQAELASNYTSVYMYQFSFYGTKSLPNYKVEGAGKVAHFDELAYLFKMEPYPIGTDADLLTRRRFTKLWTNFAKTLNPTPDESELLQNITWPKVTADNIQYLDIDESLVAKSPNMGEFTTWSKIYDTYEAHPLIVF
ncbi:juvenile hormone esterase-like [Cylas formicarius]|uniref:juvenile hormone esterase-like n=1 Tax=Cylas formicarius TaxID=197179 RepID=UPI0029588D55|nr:juvenile hormone esterase-like [Cylas formicarius]